jgi:diguanylate cyclase (GGDEF)-like protein
MQAAAAVGVVVFLASLFGIVTRPLGFLAVIWPANAILLGLLVTRPDFAGPLSWLAAFLGFMLAGLVSGDTTVTNLWLTSANLAGVTTGHLLFRRLDIEDRRLQRPLSMLHLCLISVAAASAAALVGCGLMPVLFDRPWSSGLAFWFTTELGNYLIILPVLLTVPATLSWRARLDMAQLAGLAARLAPKLAPLGALGLSVIASILIGGPGAIAYSVPALLWCALSGSLFTVSVIVLLFSLTMMSAEAAGIMILSDGLDRPHATISFRLGIALLALGPLTVASINGAQRRLMVRLNHAASRDGLTGVLARRAFLEHSTKVTAEAERLGFQGAAMLMIDLDNFKQINDRHGHAAGDAVLVATTEAIGRELRKTDLFGRLGGEEFAVTLFDIGATEALLMAERLREAVAQRSLSIDAATSLRATISIGIAHCSRIPREGLVTLLPLADAALYQAKAAGRNRVRAATDPTMPDPAFAMATPRPAE